MQPTFHDATAADYPDFARLFPELASGDGVPTAENWQQDSMRTTLFARAGGAVVGYAFYRLFSGVGYIAHLVVAPEARGKGHGRSLMEEVARRFRARAIAEWCLNVKPDNAAAVGLYRSLGMRRVHDSVALRLTWEQVERLPVQPGITGRLIEPEEDEHVRAAFELLPGQLAETRSYVNRRALGLFEGAAPRGVAGLNLTFAPDGMGSFPFRVARVDLARNLLDAMRACGGPEQIWGQAVVENDALLVDYLLGAGASVHLRIEHQRGPLPAES